MTYFADLSPYSYFADSVRPRTLNVGWLTRGFEYQRVRADDDDLMLLWCYCKVPIAQTRGIHRCNLCEPEETITAERDGQSLLLGTAEIRVFAQNGTVFAAPTLIYHYMSAHDYQPPREFMIALRSSQPPPDQPYFDELKQHGLPWSKAPESSGSAREFRLSDLPD